MEEFLSKVKKVNDYLLNTWVANGQSGEDKTVEPMAMEIIESEFQANLMRECDFKCSFSGGEGVVTYQKDNFDAMDSVEKETSLQLYIFFSILNNPYNPESPQFKFIRRMQQENGFN